MGYFRNPEIRTECVFWGISILLLAGCGCYMAGGTGACLCLAAGCVFSLLHFLSSVLRYRRIAALADEVQHFLHSFSFVDIGGEREGELSILRSEIQKMVNKLNRQAKLLTEDKHYLMNSIADISHQIRTPLTAINLIVSRLRSDVGGEKHQELVRELEQLLCHMDWLIETLLKMAKLDAGTVQMKRTPVAVQALVREATQDLAIPMELRQQTLSISCPGDASFLGDLSWSREALGNLVKNCVEHTPEGGRIDVMVTDNQLYTEIVVCDDGPGISSADLPHIFERFYKGKNSSKNSVGIGLALARMIVKEQGGTLSASNGREGGARFEMRFYKGVV